MSIINAYYVPLATPGALTPFLSLARLSARPYTAGLTARYGGN